MSVRRLCLAAVTVAACLIPTAAATAADPGIVLGGSQFDDARALDAIHRSGVGWIRIYAYRNELEPRPDVLNARLVDAYAQQFARAVPDVAAWEVWQEADAAKWWPRSACTPTPPAASPRPTTTTAPRTAASASTPSSATRRS